MTITDRYAPVRKRTHIPWPSDLSWEERNYGPISPRPPARRTFTKPKGPTPILALDVDGPISPFRSSDKLLRSRGFRSVAWRGEIAYQPGSTWVPYSKLWLNPNMGRVLAAFSREHRVELVWASLWERNAQTIVAPVLGLPHLDYVDFHGHPVNHLWKWPALADYAVGRPLAFLDDSVLDKRKVAQRRASGFDRARRNLPTLVRRVNPAVGICPDDLAVVASWLQTARLAWSV